MLHKINLGLTSLKEKIPLLKLYDNYNKNKGLLNHLSISNIHKIFHQTNIISSFKSYAFKHRKIYAFNHSKIYD